MAGPLRALQFQEIFDETQVTHPTLDAWMVSWGRMTIQPSHLCETPEDIAETLRNRQEKCGVRFRCYAMAVSSFVTYVNAVCRVINATGGSLVSSSPRQLPEFQVFIADAIRRSRKTKATKEAGKRDPGVLQEEEFMRVMDIQPRNAMEKQKRNILALVWASGLRADSIAHLQKNSFREETLPDGTRALRIVIGNMKNLPATIDRCDAALFQQLIVQGSDEKYCPIAAVDNQKKWLEELFPGEDDDKPLFRSVVSAQGKLRTVASTQETYRGMANWVSQIIGRKVVFKDCGRRAAMSRLMKNSELSPTEIAKYFGVHVNTALLYHRMNFETPQRAATILSTLGKKAQKEEGHPGNSLCLFRFVVPSSR